MSAHTSGPWELDPADQAHVTTKYYHVISAGCGFLSPEQMDRKPGFRIAGHMTEADARLIAAAPDLLAALQNLLSHPAVFDGDVICELVDAAEDAVAKATRVAP